MRLFEILTKLVGTVVILVGTFFTVAGAYGLAGGTGLKFTIGETILDAQESGPIFSIVGIVALFFGIALIYIRLKPSRMNIFSLVLGLCSVIVPAPLFGMGYTVVASIIAAVLGFSFYITVLIWLNS